MGINPDIKQLQDEVARLTQEMHKEIAARRELAAYKHQMDAIFDNAPVEIYLKDREGRYLRVNRQFEKIFGVKNDELVGRLPYDAHDPELARSTRDQDLAVLNSGEVDRREELARLVTDDEIHTLLAIKFPIFDDSGTINGLGAVVTDITDQKQAEKRYIDLVNALDGIIWESDNGWIDTTFFVSEKVTRFLGYTVEECQQSGFWSGRYHPRDRHRVEDEFRKVLLEKLETSQFEYRLIDRDGRTVYVRDLVTIEWKDGQVGLLRGIMIDITAQKQVELARHEAEERFRRMFNAAPIGLVLAEFDNSVVVELNPAYCRIVGREADEIRRVGWHALTHPDDFDREMELFERFKSGDIPDYNLEKRYRQSDGESVWVQAHVCHIDLAHSSSRQYLVMVEDITERKRNEAKIWQQANYDFLTALPNRNMLVDRINELIKRETRGGSEFAMLLIDLDGFKDINDTQGHDKGDKLLVDVARRIKGSLRSSDTVARLGGDEFVVIVSDLARRRNVDRIAQHIIEVVGEAFRIDEEPVYISASIGITIFPEDGEDFITLIRNADQAMYAAKRLGRCRFQYFTEDMQLQAQKRMQLIAEMRKAISDRRFVLYYQPIIELTSGQICKAEALVRWVDETNGIISPEQFIPLAEETGLINEIGDQIFDLANHQVNRWKESSSGQFQISINVSPVQFDNPERIAKFLTPWQASGTSVCIEITESLLMSPNQSVVNLLLEFRDTGIQVALDDFGTGYSSLSYLRKFDIDFLKIDRSFVQSIGDNKDDLALCRAIVAMAHTLGIKVIAEGIETDQQRQLLIGIGCDYGQGFLFCKPLPADEFETFVSDQGVVDPVVAKQ